MPAKEPLIFTHAPLIATVAVAFVFAFALGFIASKLRIQPLVGYLLAGVLIGPFTPGYVGDLNLAGQLADIGIILLMFGVGLHFSFRDILEVRALAVPGSIVQMCCSSMVGFAAGRMMGWTAAASLILGLSISFASTIVVLRNFEQRGTLNSPEARTAIGWAILQDVVAILTLVMMPELSSLGTHGSIVSASAFVPVLETFVKVAVFIGAALVIGKRVIPAILTQAARTGSRELFTLGVLAVALGIAFGSSALFGVSLALGAFFAGVILNESDLSHKAGQDSLPLQDAFAVLFFVSIGMLFDPSVLVREPWRVLAIVLSIIFPNFISAAAILRVRGTSTRSALIVATGIAQIGEFSFILSGLSLDLKLLTQDQRNLLLAGSIISIAVNPLLFLGIPRCIRLIDTLVGRPGRSNDRPSPAPAETANACGLVDHAIIVGHGRVGRTLSPLLERESLPFLVIERDRAAFEGLRARGIAAIYGDANSAQVLEAAGIGTAQLLVIASPDSYSTRSIIEIARRTNPPIPIVVRTHTEEELRFLQGKGIGFAVLGERELGRKMSEHALRCLGVPADRARHIVLQESDVRIAARAERT